MGTNGSDHYKPRPLEILWSLKKRIIWLASVLTILLMVFTILWRNDGLYDSEPSKPYLDFDGYPKSKDSMPAYDTETTIVDEMNEAESTQNFVNISEDSTRKKLILFWTSCYGVNSTEGWFTSINTFQDCPYKCEFTMDKSLYNLSDAIFVEGVPNNQPPPPVHNFKNQIWAFFRIEAPPNAQMNMRWDHFENNFNWTMTYRRDSDILWPAARFIPIAMAGSRLKYKIPSMESLKNKKMAAWMVSNCYTQSKREKYVKILQKYIQIDIYGKCANLKCDSGTNCYEELAKKYKFWLAFENSICADYVTEKMYFAMKAGMVPIVYGHPSLAAVAIPGSYINILDFDSAMELAGYLQYLDENPEEYLKYFEWMNEFVMLSDRESIDRSWCDVCTKLNTMDTEKDRKFYSSVGKWFNQNYTDNRFCYNPVFDEEGRFELSAN